MTSQPMNRADVGLVAAQSRSEGFRLARLMMVLASMAPLFIFWALKGSSLVPDRCFVPICALLVLIPNLVLLVRWRIAVAQQDRRPLKADTVEDHRDHVLVYLFAMLLPFYAADLSEIRSFSATLAAVWFIVMLFWHLNLHYTNALFALLGYRVFTITAKPNGNPCSGTARIVVLSKRVCLLPEDEIQAHRLSNTVYVEIDQ